MAGGQIDVDDHVDAVDVDAASGDVGGDQGLDLALTELGQGAGAHALGLATVQGGAGHSGLDQLLADGVGAVLAAHEHDGAAVARGDLGDDLVLVTGQHLEQVVLHGGDLGDGRVDRVGARLVHVPAHELVDVTVQGGREQQRLAVGPNLVQKLADLRHEAHVAHLVGLVQHRDLDVAQVAGALFDQVGQAAGGGDEDVDTAAQLVDLAGIGAATDNVAHAHAHDAGVAAKGVAHLVGELTRGHQDQGPGAVGGGAALGAAHQDRQAEGQGLARSGAAATEDVAALDGIGNGGGLDRERGGHTVLGQLLDDVLGKAKAVEGRHYGSVRRQVTCTFLIVWRRFEEGFTRSQRTQRRNHTNAPDHTRKRPRIVWGSCALRVKSDVDRVDTLSASWRPGALLCARH